MKTFESFLEYVSYITMSLALVEFLMAVWLSSRQRDKKETLANLSVWAINRPIHYLLTGGVFLGILTPFAKLAPFHLPMTWWAIAVTLVAADLVYYWTHRISHETRLFWTYHSVHHSSKEYNLSTAIRLPWVGIIGDTLFYVPLVLLGFNPTLLVISKTLVLLYQYWIHVESIGKLDWFDRWFNSPSNHRVHHASNRCYLDRNHGGILMVWDRLFGTYQEELSSTPVCFGLTKPLNSYNPIVINFKESWLLVQDMIRANSFREAMQLAIKGPGWQPERSDEGSEKLIAAAN